MSKPRISLVALSSLGTASDHASASLITALRQDGIVVRRIDHPEERASGELLIGLVSGSSDAHKYIRGTLSPLPSEPESFAILRADAIAEADTVYLVGHDDVGLMYGIFELLGQLQCNRRSDLLPAVSSVRMSPRLPVRSVCILLYNKDLEQEWLYSREFWNSYFELLAKSRFNHFTLITGHHTSYFTPPFPFMIDVPGYEHVRVPSYTDEQRRQNLEMLRMVSGLADEWGIKFVLGIWQQQALDKDPKARNYLLYTRYQQYLHKFGHGDSMVEGLTYDDLFDYCPKALRILLHQCPKIRGLQFRMNWESGISEDHQATFYRGILEAIRDCGRPMWVDLRAKGLTSETIDTASQIGLDLVVSTKFWREHMGLPYHATENNPRDVGGEYRRYGYWDLLSVGRPYKMLYRLWFGSQKILLWGDIGYAKRFAESCQLGDGLGFEVCAPLSEKGFHNWPGGGWHIIADDDLVHYQWEFERYWAFYLAFGLAGYSADVRQPIFRAEFHRRFGGDAAQQIQDAYKTASGVLPLVTAFHGPSSNDLVYWPELDTGGLTEAYIGTSSGDAGRFYTIFEYVRDYLHGNLSAKVKPAEIAERFLFMAASITASLTRAASRIADSAGNKEWLLTRVDLEVLAKLSGYHGARILSAQKFEFFRNTGERACLRDSIMYAEEALTCWQRIVELTDGVYYDHMVFNEPPNQIGHWKDLLPFLQHDVNRLKEIDRLFLMYCENPNGARSLTVEYPWYKQTMEWNETDGVLSRWAGEIVRAAALDYPFYEQRGHEHVVQAPEALIQELFADRPEPRVVHAPLRFAGGDQEIPIRASIIGNRHDLRISVRYKMSESGNDFRSIEMHEHDANVYVALIPPAAPGHTIYYYIEAKPMSDSDPSFHGTDKHPHRVMLGSRDERPTIVHRHLCQCHPGEDLCIRATVQASTGLHYVRLHYRHLIQSEDWTVVDMTHVGGDEYEAIIAGRFITPDWDLTYAIEAMGECGNGAFYPNLDIMQPFIVVSVKSA